MFTVPLASILVFTKTSWCFQQISEKMEYTGELHYLDSDYTMLQAHLFLYRGQGEGGMVFVRGGGTGEFLNGWR